MIESIELANVATYSATAEILGALSKLNYIFGSNGAGKTTISRVIQSPGSFDSCKVTWVKETPMETLVYNRDFVVKNFTPSARVKGIFTLGEKDADNERAIEAEKKIVVSIDAEITKLTDALLGGDRKSGKKGDLATLGAEFVKTCWKQKLKHDDAFRTAFEGVRKSKDSFKDRILSEKQSNTSALAALDDLTARAKTIYGPQPALAIAAPTITAVEILAYESEAILAKKILGKHDVDIAAMIQRLGNSDWIKQGLLFYNVNDSHCPFCQQKVLVGFEASIAEYFDESFVTDTAAIATLVTDYDRETNSLKNQLQSVADCKCQFLDLEKFAAVRSAIDAKLSSNKLLLDRKTKEPSHSVELQSLHGLIAEASQIIVDTNIQVTKHNSIVANFAQEKQALSSQVWKYIVDEELRQELADFEKATGGLSKAIASLADQIRQKTQDRDKAALALKTLEKSATTIQPTINAINSLLKSFGFHTFTLAKAEGPYYKLVRANGEEAQETLSEGEKSFVTFLYFYHLLKGSESESGISSNRVVVFDDPVSSLDSDILFIVSSLIKAVFDEVRADGQIKQAFVLTHNVYFHKEVTFNPDRRGKAMNEETFWLVRKTPQGSRLESQPSNPIKTSYELLWAELRREEKNSFTIQNTLRRIVENYFKIFGGIDPKAICEKFEGKERLICNSLFSWVNDGSHYAMDDLYISLEPGAIDAYMMVFEQVFDKMGHGPHFKMMMERR
jgi:wobble nucleotide-excising tRNase